MINTTSVPARDLQKSYKSIIASVKSGKSPVVLTTWDEPQAAIVSLEDLARIQQAKSKAGALKLLKLADMNKDELKTLPANLREIADDILYTK